ncbi:MAG: hypothetical protein GX175_03435 [Halanaerobiaceae bacterium]|nr:hypothetical protein [Halanaerobiaceae bacterium]
MKELKLYLYNLIPSGAVGIIIAIFVHTFINPSTPIYILFIMYFLIGTVVGTVTAMSFNFAIYKTSSVKIAFLSAFLGIGVSVFFINILFRTHCTHGWGASLIIIAIAEIFGMIITYSSYRYYININNKLEKRKKDFSGQNR